MEFSSIQPLDDSDLLLNELSEREEKREKNFKLVQLIFVIQIDLFIFTMIQIYEI